MKIEIIEPHGLCAGVNAAIAKALTLKNVYCLHELVHNEIVIAELKALGYRFVDDIVEVPEGETVVFSAHGVSPDVRAKAAARRLKVIDTTCPFVAKVHEAVRRFAAEGLPVVVIGHPEHVEVRGIVGEAEDVHVVRNRTEAQRLQLRRGTHIGVVSQTTMDADEVERILGELTRRYEVEGQPRVCTATHDRQEAVRNFKGDALLVLGSRNSSNVRRLCEAAKCPVFMAGTMDEVRKAEEDMASYGRVGVTSGASTPERFFEGAVRHLMHVPQHVAIIMDGNGRWAERRGKPRGEGHAAGAKTLSKVVDWCGARGIRYLTVYAFSTENWKRPAAEVSGIMNLFAVMLRTKGAGFVRNRVRFRVVGRRGDLPAKVRAAVERLEKRTEQFERQLIVAVSYGGRAEIIDAINCVQGPVTEETFRQYLYAPDVPDPDLIIRTSGEKRTSNFLLWESAYSEYHFTDTLWPDFSEADLDAALADYASRHRRKGGLA